MYKRWNNASLGGNINFMFLRNIICDQNSLREAQQVHDLIQIVLKFANPNFVVYSSLMMVSHYQIKTGCMRGNMFWSLLFYRNTEFCVSNSAKPFVGK